MTVERRYVLTKVKPGDYILPSNNGRTMWRLMRYTEGPSSGLDWPKDREVWGIWKWTKPIDPSTSVDPEDWDSWTFCEGLLDTRQAAIDAAMKKGPDDVG